jgi:hypothetical protein
MSKWLLERLYTHKDQPTARFAFQGSINWMRGLAILVDSEEFSDENLRNYYAGVQRRTVNQAADTLVFENVLMSYHHISALQKFNSLDGHHYDVVRSAIISWYYAVYYAAKAMIAATSESDPQTHAEAGKVWQNNIILRNLAVGAFGLSLTDITPSHTDQTIQTMRNGNRFDLNTYPTNTDEALGCIYSYLKGTAEYTRWQTEERIRQSREFKDLGVTDFRTKVAREMRDNKLRSGITNILTQAFRYRGKANYRDSIYLSYGEDRSQEIEVFLGDLQIISTNFLRMAAFYVSKRVENGTWDEFVADIGQNSKLAISVDLLRVDR